MENEWKNKAILILSILVVVLGIILGIKMLKSNNDTTTNTIEKNNAIKNENVEIETKNKLSKDYITLNNTKEQSLLSMLFENFNMSNGAKICVSIILLLIVFEYFCLAKLYCKVGVNPIFMVILGILYVIEFGIISYSNVTTIRILSIIINITSMIILAIIYSNIGVSPFLAIIALIPRVSIILQIYTWWKIGEALGVSKSEQWGLIMLGPIYVPIIALRNE